MEKFEWESPIGSRFLAQYYDDGSLYVRVDNKSASLNAEGVSSLRKFLYRQAAAAPTREVSEREAILDSLARRAHGGDNEAARLYLEYRRL